jgi:hypothetical protein
MNQPNGIWKFTITPRALKRKKNKIKGKEYKIQTAGWKEDLYTVKVKYKDEILTGKLVVK